MATSVQGSFNLRRFERLLTAETNPARRVLISQLLSEEQARLGGRVAAGESGPGLCAAA